MISKATAMMRLLYCSQSFLSRSRRTSSSISRKMSDTKFSGPRVFGGDFAAPAHGPRKLRMWRGHGKADGLNSNAIFRPARADPAVILARAQRAAKDGRAPVRLRGKLGAWPATRGGNFAKATCRASGRENRCERRDSGPILEVFLKTFGAPTAT